MKPLYYKLCDH